MDPSSYCVAILDDDESVRKALARLLSANFFKTNTFGSAKEFLSSLECRAPACLILDLHMPDMTGLDLQHHMRRNGITIPTIIVTAHSEVGLRERCTAAGATELLLKPLSGATLINAINAATAPLKETKPTRPS